MLRFFLLRFILPLILFLIVRAVLKSVWSSRNSSVPAGRSKGESAQASNELKLDPVCGTYVAASASVTKMVDGRAVHFCSAACRDKYRTA